MQSAMRLSVILFLFFSLSLSASEKELLPKNKVSALAGIGPTYAGGGITIQYLHLIDKQLWLSSYVGIGSQSIASKIPGNWWGYNGGLNLEYGKRLFWILGLNYGAQGLGYDKELKSIVDPLAFEYIHHHLLYGPSLIAGYKFISNCGLLWQCNIGISYVKNSAGNDRNYFFMPVAGFGVGYVIKI
jgi:hypothetical protein